MSRIETLLVETLNDPERALPGWVDPVGRVRAARRAQQRRRLATAATAVAVIAGVAVAVPLLRDGEPREDSSVVSRPPAAVVTGRLAHPTGRRFGGVVAGDGVVFVGDSVPQSPGTTMHAHERIPVTYWQLGDGDGQVSGRVVGTVPGPRYTTVGGGRLWAYDNDGHEGFGKVRALDPATGVFSLERGALMPGGAMALTGAREALWMVTRAGVVAGRLQLVVERRSPATGKLLATKPLTVPERPIRLAYDGDHLWVRAAASDTVGVSDGTVLVRLDPQTLVETGRVKLPGSLSDGALTAGGGKVWATVARTSEILTTTGGVAVIDAASLDVERTIDTPYALRLGYGNGSVWLAGAKLARIDAATGQLDGEPVALSGPLRGFAVDGDLAWVVDDTGVVRYDGEY